MTTGSYYILLLRVYLSELASLSVQKISCQPATHIAYIKTHNKESSTIWSIVVNFALNHNLTIALPAARTGNNLGWPKSFAPTDATPPKPDVLCHYSRYAASSSVALILPLVEKLISILSCK